MLLDPKWKPLAEGLRPFTSGRGSRLLDLHLTLLELAGSEAGQRALNTFKSKTRLLKAGETQELDQDSPFTLFLILILLLLSLGKGGNSSPVPPVKVLPMVAGGKDEVAALDQP